MARYRVTMEFEFHQTATEDSLEDYIEAAFDGDYDIDVKMIEVEEI